MIAGYSSLHQVPHKPFSFRSRPQKLTVCSTGVVDVSSQPQTQQYVWEGTDEYCCLEDRKDSAPLPLPQLQRAVRVCLVRHGQSTWNAEGRIQGSSNLAVLTQKGVAQAITAKEMLQMERFDAMFVSPLERSRKTGEIIWSDRNGTVQQIPHLREIDLYSFQGLLKGEGKERFGSLYKDWQKRAHQFEIDNHAPVRELWYRASVAWISVFEQFKNLQDQQQEYQGDGHVLVVAHNAVNQAMIATAIGLPPSYFRRILQSNAASSVLDFQPARNGNSKMRVTIDRLNQAPTPPFGGDGAGRKAAGRVILIRAATTYDCEDDILVGRKDDECSPLGEVQALKTSEMLMDTNVDVILSSPLRRAKLMADMVSKLQSLARNGSGPPKVEYYDDLLSMELGEWQGYLAKEVRGKSLPQNAETVQQLTNRTQQMWQQILKMTAENGGRNVVVVSHWNVLTAFLCHVLGLDADYLGTFRMDPGGVTVIDFPDGPLAGEGVIRCMNYTAHLGRWAVPITRDDLDMVCGIDGCF